MSNPNPNPAGEPTGLPVSCQCGFIALTTPTRHPTGLAFCHCTSCRKQSGAPYSSSVYFPTDRVFPLPADVAGKLAVFEHATDSGGTMRCYFCPRCGVRVLHAAVLPDGETMRGSVAFKGGAIDRGLDWRGMGGVHIFTRSAVVRLEEGWVCYETVPGEGNKVVKEKREG